MSKHVSRRAPHRGGARVARPQSRGGLPRIVLGGLVSLSLACSTLAFVAPGVFAAAWDSVTFDDAAPAALTAPEYDGPPIAPATMGPSPTPTPSPTMTPLASAQAGEAPASVPGASRLSARAEAAASTRRALLADSPVKLNVLTFNVLGSSHTTARGDKPSYGPGTERAHWAADVIRAYDAALVGTQETEFDQLNVLQAELPNYTFFPGNNSDQASVRTNLAWDKTRFTMTASGYITVQFVGLRRTDPYVQLQDKATGRRFWFFNTHNSPNRGSAGTFEGERRAQLTAQVAKVNELVKSAPVIFVGDFNDHDYTYCRLTGSTPLRAAQGGGVNPCRLPSWHRIDWIFGAGVAWSDARQDRGPLVSRTTDHYVLSATATLG